MDATGARGGRYSRMVRRPAWHCTVDGISRVEIEEGEEMSLVLPPSSGLQLHLAAWEPNTAQGAPLYSGAFMPSWKNRGSGVADAAQASSENQPQWKAAQNRWPVVQFDGVSDRFGIASSTTTLAFIHETGLFDIILAIRPAANRAAVVAGNAYSGGETGFTLERVYQVEGAPLNFYVFCGVDSYRVFTSGNYFSAPCEPGQARKYLFRGRGPNTQLQASPDLATIYTSIGATGLLPATLPVGPATYDTQIGAINGANFFGGEIMDFMVYDRNLSSGELATMVTYFNERYGI